MSTIGRYAVIEDDYRYLDGLPYRRPPGVTLHAPFDADLSRRIRAIGGVWNAGAWFVPVTGGRHLTAVLTFAEAHGFEVV